MDKINIPLVRIFPMKSFTKRLTWKFKLVFRKMKYHGWRKLGLKGATELKFNEFLPNCAGGAHTPINI